MTNTTMKKTWSTAWDSGAADAGQAFVQNFMHNRDKMLAAGAVDPMQSHDACGVGMIATLDGKPRRDVVLAGIEALKVLFHRGAVDADGKTGDGAGIHVEIPQDFFKDHVRRTGHEPESGVLAIGMVFLPKTDMNGQEHCRTIVENEVLRCGYGLYGWRQVPVNVSVIGEKANATRPEIEQVMIVNSKGVPEEEFERDLYVIRRRIENHVREQNITDFYICSMSCRSVIYKGLFLAEQLTTFYPDLLDERFVSRFALYHQRYSTNTFPTWRLAQPFRMLAHNGEINTITGNINWMKSHETRLAAETFGENVSDLKPIIQPGGSDSASLDNVFELLCRGGRSSPLVKCMMIPESIGQNTAMPEEHRSMFWYFNTMMAPWDGPAAICATDGQWVVAGMDRNGLRPMRYIVTDSNLLIVGSEAGMVRVPEASVIEKGRLGPGNMISVNLDEGVLYHDNEIKDFLASKQPYGEWVKRITLIDDLNMEDTPEPENITGTDLRRRQMVYGLTMEDMENTLTPMVEEGKEAIGSMGDDTPLAVLSDIYRPMHHYFRQNFSQVTNPPIDSLRETRVMSLKTRLGNLGNILAEDESQCNILQLDSPVLLNREFAAMRSYMGDTVYAIDTTFDINGGSDALREAMERIREEAEDAVRGGCQHLILTDKAVSDDRAPAPMILCVGAVHSHLVRNGLRTFISLNVQCGACMDTHYYAVLIGAGATTVNAYLTQDAIVDRYQRGLFPGLTLEQCLDRFKTSIDHGLLKIMSKMGIGMVSSYRGGYNFEAVGLSRTLVAEYFPGMNSRISGIGLNGLQHNVVEQHDKAFRLEEPVLPIGGFHRIRQGEEVHAWQGKMIHELQKACATGDYAKYKEYSKYTLAQPPINLRDLLGIKSLGAALQPEEVESVTEIRKQFVTPGMSLGALSPEAHGALNIAMNRIGAKSTSGEGGEVRDRYMPTPEGDNANSAIKQVASGRFGVTAEYLNQCREIEIKVAQGAKPGEGGQLPGFKVTEMVAKLRHSTPGVTLISPPPHHDIYSIEDLAQLIYDLKQINPKARVCVKLVARSGIGTIAAGVAKAKADVILISGYNGGTGASPMTSLKFAGLPWEMGLAEAHQMLTLNRLRENVTLRVDGGFRNGRDIVIAAMLGAEEFGIGTLSLISMGCIMVRQCHSNTCPVGVCTQDEDLRAKFKGTPERVVNLFTFIAEEVKEILASIGVSNLKDIVGRSDLLHQVSRGSSRLDDLDLNPILVQPDVGGSIPYCSLKDGERNEVADTLDMQMVVDAKPALEDGEKMQLSYDVRNVQRAIGTRLSHHIVKRFGMTGLRPGHITVQLRGTAGQSFGAFAVQGLKLEMQGDANDYVGKGLSGGTISIRPPISSKLATNKNTIIGNTVLYGATSGKLFAAGQAGERFCVRNSGAQTVVEGCGSNGCEYMTGGTTVILGPVGHNFAAGMTGGMAYIYDPDKQLAERLNKDSVICQRIEVDYYEQELKALIEEHVKETQSRFAQDILLNWDYRKRHFWHIVPKEMLDKLEVPVTAAAAAE